MLGLPTLNLWGLFMINSSESAAYFNLYTLDNFRLLEKVPELNGGVTGFEWKVPNKVVRLLDSRQVSK